MKEKLKELTKDTAIYGISTIIGRLFNFLLVPFYMQFFTTTEMGIYGNIYAYVAFFNIAFIYGMDAAFLKYSSTAESENKKIVFSTPFFLILFTSILFSAGISIFSPQISILMQIPQSFNYYLFYIAAILLFDTLALIPFANLRLERKSKKFAVIKLVNIAINLILNVILIVKFDMGIEAVLISNAVASTLTFLILLPEIIKFIVPSFDKALLKKMINFGIPYLPASISAIIVQVIDRPLLTHLTNFETTGIYTANYKLGIAMMLFVGMFQYAWQPFFLTNAKEKNAKEIFAKVLTLFLIVGSLIVLTLSLFIDNLAAIPLPGGRFIIAPEYWEGMTIIPIILTAYLFHGMYVNFQAGIYIKEKTKYFPLITISGAVVNILANLFLIPKYGYVGAAYATLVSYITMASLIFIIVQKFYTIKYEYTKIALIFVLLITALGTLFYLNSVNSLYFLYKVIILLAFVGALIVLKVVSKDELANGINLFLKKTK